MTDGGVRTARPTRSSPPVVALPTLLPTLLPRLLPTLLLTLLLAGVVAAGLPLLRPARWAATVTTALEPAERAGPATPYVYDVQSRPQVVATYAAILADPRFLREAGAALALDRERVNRARVQVTQAPRSAVLTATVTSPRRADATNLAPAVATAARRYIDQLDALYVLRPAVAGSPVEVRRVPRYGLSTAVLFAVTLLPAWLLSRLLATRWSGRASRKS